MRLYLHDPLVDTRIVVTAVTVLISLVMVRIAVLNMRQTLSSGLATKSERVSAMFAPISEGLITASLMASLVNSNSVLLIAHPTPFAQGSALVAISLLMIRGVATIYSRGRGSTILWSLKGEGE